MNSLREIQTAHGNLRQGIEPKTLLELSVVASIRARIERGISAAQCLKEDEEKLIATRLAELKRELMPRGTIQELLVKDVAAAYLRLERCELDEEAWRYNKAMRAGGCWSLDREVEILELAEKLRVKPALIARKLRQTLQGCAWLLAQFKVLAAQVGGAGGEGVPCPLDDNGRSRACDLLGLDVAERVTANPLDPPAGSEADAASHQGALIAQQVAELETLIAGEMVALDTAAKAAAQAGGGPGIDRSIRQIRRDEAAAHRNKNRALAEIQRLKEEARAFRRMTGFDRYPETSWVTSATVPPAEATVAPGSGWDFWIKTPPTEAMTVPQPAPTPTPEVAPEPSASAPAPTPDHAVELQPTLLPEATSPAVGATYLGWLPGSIKVTGPSLVPADAPPANVFAAAHHLSRRMRKVMAAKAAHRSIH